MVLDNKSSGSEKIKDLNKRLEKLKKNLKNLDSKANEIFNEDLLTLEFIRDEFSKEKEHKIDLVKTREIEDSKYIKFEKKLYDVLEKYRDETKKRI